MRVRLLIPAALFAAVVVTAACDDNINEPSPPDTVTLGYSARLQPGAFAWRSVRVERAGEVKVQLVTLSPNNEAVVALGFGRFENNGCTVTNAVNTAPGNEAQLAVGVQPGTYCVRVADIGNLDRDWTFSIAIVIPNPDL